MYCFGRECLGKDRALLLTADYCRDAAVEAQYFGYLIQRTSSLEKDLMLERLKAGGEEGDRE